MTATHVGLLNLPALPDAARKVYIVPELANKSLISVSQLCKAGCTVTFDAEQFQVQHNNVSILVGYRNPHTGLYQIDAIAAPTQVESANAASTIQSAADTIRFLHAAFGFPTLKTLQAALAKSLIHGVPGLTTTLLLRYPPHSPETFKGHMAQARKNQRSTKPKPKTTIKYLTPKLDIEDGTVTKTQPNGPMDKPTGQQYNVFPIDDGHETETETDDTDLAIPRNVNAPTEYCYSTVFQPTHKTYSDQTGQFNVDAASGNKYMFILYDQASNSIMAEAIKDRTDANLAAAFCKLYDQLVIAGSQPKLHILDNESGKKLRDAFASRGVNHQFVPPYVHRRNAAERAIRTYKDHFISILSGTDENFPTHLWDQLIPQANLTLNLLRASRINPKHSAYSQLHGPYLYNNTPIAPLGAKVLIHVKPKERTTWDVRAIEGYYIGPAMHHYRCYRCYIPSTNAYRITDTLAWLTGKYKTPTATSTDIVTHAINELTDALRNPTTGAPLVPYEDSTIIGLKQLAQIFAPPTFTNDATMTPHIDTATQHNASEMRVTEPENAASEMRVTEPENAASEMRVASTNNLTSEMLVDAATLPPMGPIPQQPTTPCPVFETPPQTTSTKRQRRRQRRKPAKLGENHATIAITREEIPVSWLTAAFSALLNANDEYACHGHAINPDTGAIAEYGELIKCSDGEHWIKAMTDEIGRLMKGHKTMQTGTYTMKWIKRQEIPQRFKITYCRIVCADRPEKANRYRVRLTVGGDRLEYSGNASTKTADLTTVKLAFNSTISTRGARWVTIDIKDFYLNTTMPWEDRCYMRIPVALVPPAILEHYQLQGMVYNGFLYVEITKGMYGLKQAGRLANEQLTLHLAEYGYEPCSITPGLWRHQTRDILFTLVVDDFGIKYTKAEDLTHLITALEAKYTISIDMTGTKYCGLQLKWDYDNGTCDISMPGYIERALARFEHPQPTRAQNAPHPWTLPQYGTKTQLTPEFDESPALGKKDITRIQEILGTLLYYARAVDSTLLTAISSLSSEQAHGTEQTMKKITHLLNYCATHPNAIIRYNRSDMILHVESDASYLSESKARSRAAGYYYLSCAPNHPTKTPAPTDKAPPINGAITVLCSIMKEIVSSAAEAELAALFHNAKEAVAIRIALDEMGHPQPATPIVTDNSTATGIVNDTVKQRRSKAIDMRFYWVRDRSRKGEFTVYWKKGSQNRADYFSKHHPGTHHTEMRPMYIHMDDSDQFASLTFHYIAHEHATSDDDDADTMYAFSTIMEIMEFVSTKYP